MMKLISDDCVFENRTPSPDGSIYSGKEKVAQFWHRFFFDSPNVPIEIEDILG